VEGYQTVNTIKAGRVCSVAFPLPACPDCPVNDAVKWNSDGD